MPLTESTFLRYFKFMLIAAEIWSQRWNISEVMRSFLSNLIRVYKKRVTFLNTSTPPLEDSIIQLKHLKGINFRAKIFKLYFLFSQELIFSKNDTSNILREFSSANFVRKTFRKTFRMRLKKVITRLARNLICTILKLKYAGIKFHEFRGLTVNK